MFCCHVNWGFVLVEHQYPGGERGLGGGKKRQGTGTVPTCGVFFAMINGSQGVSMTRQVNPNALKEPWASDTADRQVLLISFFV